MTYKYDLFIPDQNPPLILIEVVYTCTSCKNSKILFQPPPQELDNKDFRQWCSACKQIKEHTRSIPKEL